MNRDPLVDFTGVDDVTNSVEARDVLIVLRLVSTNTFIDPEDGTVWKSMLSECETGERRFKFKFVQT